VPEKVALDRADQLIAAVESVKDKKSSTYKNAVLQLFLSTRGLSIDAERIKKIDAMTGSVGQELEKHQKNVLNGLKDFDAKSFGQILDDNRKPYRFTSAEVWFQQAESVANMKFSAKNLELQKEENPKILANDKKQLAAQIDELEKQLLFAELKQELADIRLSLKVPEAVPVRRKRGQS